MPVDRHEVLELLLRGHWAGPRLLSEELLEGVTAVAVLDQRLKRQGESHAALGDPQASLSLGPLVPARDREGADAVEGRVAYARSRSEGGHRTVWPQLAPDDGGSKACLLASFQPLGRGNEVNGSVRAGYLWQLIWSSPGVDPVRVGVTSRHLLATCGR